MMMMMHVSSSSFPLTKVFYGGLNNSKCFRIPTGIRTSNKTLLAFAVRNFNLVLTFFHLSLKYLLDPVIPVKHSVNSHHSNCLMNYHSKSLTYTSSTSLTKAHETTTFNENRKIESVIAATTESSMILW